MGNQAEEMVYETPRVRIVEVEVEQGFSLSNVENPRRGGSTDW